jgi:hypothetical protein
MELIDADVDVKCDDCPYHGLKVVEMSDGNRLCETCLIKALILIRPIKFNKEEIKAWLISRYLDDEETCAQEGMSCHLELDFGKFMDWIKPFLESK